MTKIQANVNNVEVDTQETKKTTFFKVRDALNGMGRGNVAPGLIVAAGVGAAALGAAFPAIILLGIGMGDLIGMRAIPNGSDETISVSSVLLAGAVAMPGNISDAVLGRWSNKKGSEPQPALPPTSVLEAKVKSGL